MLPRPLKAGSNLCNLMSNFLHGLGRVGWLGKWCLFAVPLREDLAHNKSFSMQIYAEIAIQTSNGQWPLEELNVLNWFQNNYANMW